MSTITTRSCFIGAVAAACIAFAAGAAETVRDIVIYGSSPAAIAAAVQAKRMGKTAVVVSPETRIGGLTTGGLGQTDIGNKSAFGGIALEFYRDVAKWYADPAHWTRQKPKEYVPKGQTAGKWINAESMWSFEPSAALAILEGWEKRDKLDIRRGEWLDRTQGVEKKDGRIVSIKTLSGNVYRGKVFIDATYEGDLMAAAGVSYAVGREANSVYGETISGIQRRMATAHQLQWNISAYVVKGKPESGLLPGIEPLDPNEKDGDGDRRVQAYCFRMCLTDDPKNRIPFKKPENYNEKEYEILFRNYEKGQEEKGLPWINSPMPNRKTDTNNRTGVSTDFIGRNYEWPEASYERRAEIFKAHLDYQQGLMWTLANHPRIPAKVRKEISRWGTCRDEFLDGPGDGWQSQLYVREARRMVGEYVMTEHECRGDRKVSRPIAMGAYTMDSHHVRRVVTARGNVQNEGDVEDSRRYSAWGKDAEKRKNGGRMKPYGIDYGAICPKRGECLNLLVPVCLSSSHMAFGSIRMEPVFFALGQAAGTAASMAAAKGAAVQDVPYNELSTRLAADGQVMELDSPRAPAPAFFALDLSGEWHVAGTNFEGRIRLPGTLADAGLGEFQTPAHHAAYTERTAKASLALKYKYFGPATYSRKVVLTAETAAKPLEVFLERVMWTSRLKIDGREYGFCDSLGVPHVHRIPAGALAAGEHLVEIEIDNSRQYGVATKAHGYAEWTQSIWHGAIGRIELRETNPLESVRVFADFPANGKVRFELPEGFAADAETVTSDDLAFKGFKAESSPYATGRILVTATLAEEPQAWDEFNPRLYNVTFRDRKSGFEKKIRFGFRTPGRDGNRLMLNGRPLFVRADLDNCHFPLTGYPAMTKREWMRYFTIQRNNGMNAVRFHTWTPPEAAFEAADETGMMMFCELAYWNESGVKSSYAGRGNAKLDDWIRRELKAVADTYGNHPSMVAITFGNELGFCNFKELDRWMSVHKKYDPRRLAMCSTARAVAPCDDFMVTHLYPGIGPTRGKYEGAADYDYETVYSKAPIPVIAHEIGQWPIYPVWDIDIPKFNGLLQPWRWIPRREMAVSNNTFRFAREFHSASMQTSRHFYKLETEGLLRTPSCDGIVYLGMRDYTGHEGLAGWYDAFFDAKPALGEVPPFSVLMSTTPCLAKIPKFIFTPDETFTANLLVRNELAVAIPAGTLWHWSFGAHCGWAKAKSAIPPGALAEVGTVSVPLAGFDAPGRHEFKFGDNSWRIYVLPRLPAKEAPPKGVLVTADPAAAAKALAAGGRVIYTGNSGKSDITTFTPVYWSTDLFKTNRKHIGFGAVVDADHPALAATGCDYWMDEFWRKLFTDGKKNAVSHRLEGLPKDFRPIITVVPDLHHSYFISPFFEVQVGEGRLIVCGLNINADCPGARLFRHALCRYAESEEFNPRWKVSPKWFTDVFLVNNGPKEKAVKLEGDAKDMLNL